MSEAGLQVINAASTFLITDKNPTLGLVAKGSTSLSVSVPASGTAPQYWRGTPSLPSGHSAYVLALRSTGFFWPEFNGTQPRYGSDVSGTVIDWYMFARPPVGSGAGAGLQVFDEAGRCTYDSEQRVGKVMQLLDTPNESNAGPVTPQTLYTGPLFPSGREYAAIFLSGVTRIAMLQVPGPAYYLPPMMSCSNRVTIKERLQEIISADTDDRRAGGNTSSLIIDVTGY